MDSQTERAKYLWNEKLSVAGKKQYHKEKIKDTLKVVTLLGVNKLYRMCTSTV